MPESLAELIRELEAIAAYEGPWRVLRENAPLLQARVAELRERASREDGLLVIALVGGSGVGKSTLLNAIAGDEIAETSELRPCTEAPMVYHPPGAQLDFGDWRYVARSALENLVLIDTPDSDTVIHHHREQAEAALDRCDAVLLCASAEKYLDEATWSLLRPLRGQRAMVCVETKARAGEGVSEHWRARLAETGFDLEPEAFFRVNALAAFDRKLSGQPPGETELDFPRLEALLRHELSRERIARIKRSNVAGLVAVTVGRLRDSVAPHESTLANLSDVITRADRELGHEAARSVERRAFAEPHLWSHAVGREMSLRARGGIGFLFRCMEVLRALPARLPQLMPWNTGPRSDSGKAAHLLGGAAGAADDLRLAADDLASVYRSKESEVNLAFTKAGFSAPPDAAGLETFQAEMARRVNGVLRGPARERVVRAARALTSWPVAILFDAAPAAFLANAGYAIVRAYFDGQYLDAAFFYHTGAMLMLLLGVELVLLSWLGRLVAWRARLAGRRDLAAALAAPLLAFAPQRTSLAEARAHGETIARLTRTRS